MGGGDLTALKKETVAPQVCSASFKIFRAPPARGKVPGWPSSPAQSLFEALPGAWVLHREIEDARLGAGAFVGRASFAPQADGRLLYEEHGELQLGARRGPAWRRWIYALEGDALAVRYPDTLDELHLFRFGDGRSAQHRHFCGADCYQADLSRGADDSFSLLYAVSGPAKDYRLRTVLTRV
ncbi:MAG: hypothetical protein HY054_12610 [Proteobacteria bacterium]|nr:hypothetical protein [Pseudomonadota bacterium]